MGESFDFVDRALAEGLPDRTNAIYASNANISQEGIEQVNPFIRQFGAFKYSNAAACSGTPFSNDLEDFKTRDFIHCAVDAQMELVPARVFLIWEKEGNDWKLHSFEARFAPIESVDQSGDNEDVAETASED